MVQSRTYGEIWQTVDSKQILHKFEFIVDARL